MLETLLTDTGAPNRLVGYLGQQFIWKLPRTAPAISRLGVSCHGTQIRTTAEGALRGINTGLIHAAALVKGLYLLSAKC